MESERLFVKILAFLFILTLGLLTLRCVMAKQSPEKAKFYDFSEQLIDGQIKRPTALYTDVRRQAQFKRLLKIKRSFMPQLFRTAKDPVFR